MKSARSFDSSKIALYMQVLEQVAAPHIDDERHPRLGGDDVGEVLIRRDAEIHAARPDCRCSAGITYWKVCSFETRFSDRKVPFGSEKSSSA